EICEEFGMAVCGIRSIFLREQLGGELADGVQHAEPRIDASCFYADETLTGECVKKVESRVLRLTADGSAGGEGPPVLEHRPSREQLAALRTPPNTPPP